MMLRYVRSSHFCINNNPSVPPQLAGTHTAVPQDNGKTAQHIRFVPHPLRSSVVEHPPTNAFRGDGDCNADACEDELCEKD